MPRKPNSAPTAKITISTTPQIYGYLQQLVRTGLYGKNPAEAAERLVSEGIGRLVDKPVIKLET
jgi:hypothetical protein